MCKLTRQRSSKRIVTEMDKEGRDEDTNVDGNEKLDELAAEMKEMKRQMEYQDKLRNISMKAISVSVEEQNTELQKLQVQIQEMSMEMDNLKTQIADIDLNVDDPDRPSNNEHRERIEHSLLSPKFNYN